LKREPEALLGHFDVLVVGAGVTGAAMARTLARSGLRTALVERNDFGGATTHNSAKIVHGGLRYVQHLDAVRIRESIRSQNAWLATAPNLVSPLRFTMPTRGWGARGPIALALGMVAYRALGGRRHPSLARMEVGSRAAFARNFASVNAAGVSGHASWYDAQIRDSGRLITECIADAVAAGAVAVNHMEADQLVLSGGVVEGVAAHDVITGAEYQVRADMTITCIGPWTPWFFEKSGIRPDALGVSAWTRNMNVVLKREIVPEGAVGVMSRQAGDAVIGNASRLYFVSPWQGATIVGTTHDTYREKPDEIGISAEEVSAFLEDVGSALSGEPLSIDEVAYLHIGISPAEETGHHGAKRTVVQDEHDHGLRQCLAITANKYTTAPEVAKLVTKRILKGKLAYSKAVHDFNTPMLFALEQPDPISRLPSNASLLAREHAWVHAIYGQHADDLLGIANRYPDSDPGTQLFKARVEFGIRREMACRLVDVIFRCTDRAERGCLGLDELFWAAKHMASALKWSDSRMHQELELVRTRLTRHMSSGPLAQWRAPFRQAEPSVSLGN
jgi:glycerol-3-phosphate dehydrogenase